jgi:UPF0755 protein
MKKLIVLVLLLAGCGVAGNRGYDFVNTSVNQPMSASSQPVKVHIDQGESTDQIAHDLYARGLIRSPEVFLLYLRYANKGSSLEAGDFVLNKNMTMVQIIAALGKARVEQVTVTLPEGSIVTQMAQKAAAAGLGKPEDYLAAAQDLTWPYDFLKDRPGTAPKTLEGYLFPDTYKLDRGATARDLVKRQLERFGQLVTPDLRALAGKATPARPVEPLYAVVTLASMVEREINQAADRPIVCDIYYNRLAKGMLLQVDATVLYGLGKWETSIIQADLAKDTPYNTYLHKGLPPGPISNPGLDAIKACLSPQKTDYLFYFADPKGVTHYARTQTEFLLQQRQFGVAGR